MVTLIKVVLATAILAGCGAHKLLVVFPMPSKSHSILGDGVVRHLLEAGNEVTYITPFVKKNPPKGLTQIDVTTLFLEFQVDQILNMTRIIEDDIPANDIFFLFGLLKKLTHQVILHENVQNLLNDPIQRFDAVIAEWMLNDFYSGIAQVYGCPYILYTPVDLSTHLLPMIDDIQNPAYTTSTQIAHLPPFSFVGRVKELFIQTLILFLKNVLYKNDSVEEYNAIFVPVLKKLGRPIHPYNEVKTNVSLVLANSHVSLGYAQKLPLNYLNIGGYHIETDVQPLPKDLQDLMDNAKNGVIYFSMGSNLKSRDLPARIKTSLLKMFGTLKQTVLWKFEEDLAGVPDNVKILKWAPQPSILAHPNCVLFITHGGLLSTTETIHYGVPVIGIPVFGDQFVNVELSVVKGFAKRVTLSYQVADSLKVAIEEMVSNPKYREKVKELSFIYHHRPIHPGKLLVHGVEHVILTKGAPHLRSPAFLTPWYHKMYLDLAAIILAAFYIVKAVVRKLCARKQENVKIKKN